MERTESFLNSFVQAPIAVADEHFAGVRPTDLIEERLLVGNLVKRNSPVVISVTASPKPPGPLCAAAKKLFPRASRASAAVTVPGVITRITSRCTTPLANFGSSTCSQTATL